MKFIILVCSITLFITNNLSAQIKISLSEANGILESNNTNIKQAALREKVSRIELDQAYDNLIPNLGFSMNNQNTMGLNFDQITGQLITGNQWTHFVNANVNSSITLFQGFRGYNNIQLSKVNLDLSKMDTKRLKYELRIQSCRSRVNRVVYGFIWRSQIPVTRFAYRYMKKEGPSLFYYSKCFKK